MVLFIQLDAIFIQIGKQIIRAQHFGNLDELVVVVVAMEKGLLSENHACKHTTKTPQIQAIVVFLEIHQ